MANLFNTCDRSQSVSSAIGGYYLSVSPTEEAGWLLCDGRAISRATYWALFAKISTTFGAGNNTTTFNLPDMRGRVPGGAGQGTFALSFANTDVIVAANDITVPSNRSIFTGTPVVLSTTGTAPGGLTAGTTYYAIRESSTLIMLATTRANAVAGTAIDITSQGTGNHTLTVTYTNRVVGNIVGEEEHSLTVAEIPAHTHTINDNYGTQDLEAVFNNGNAADEITRDETTSATGGSGSHNVMQPTIFAGYWFIYAGA